jgi:hypothetical protein
MSFFTNFARDREILQNDGVYIGGWTLKNVIKPAYKDNKHGRQQPCPDCTPMQQIELMHLQ